MAISDVMHPQIAEPPTEEPPMPRSEPSRSTADVLEPGARVEVRNRLDGAWAQGFEVLAVDEGGYRLRRLSDGNELPLIFSGDDVRTERRRNNMWWY